MAPDICKCGRRLKGAKKNSAIHKDDDDKIKIKCTETCFSDIDVSFNQETHKTVYKSKSMSQKPYETMLHYAPLYKRPVGSEVLTCYKFYSGEIESSNCLAFLNNKTADKWSTLKRQIPLANGRILRLPAKSQLHFNNYFLRELHPECAASWKLLEKPKQSDLEQGHQ